MLLQNGGDVERAKLDIQHKQLAQLRRQLWDDAEVQPLINRGGQSADPFRKIEISPDIELQVRDKSLGFEVTDLFLSYMIIMNLKFVHKLNMLNIQCQHEMMLI